MRIISGSYKGRELKGFDIDGTRPTMNRVKESLFAMIQEKVKGSTCLDLFAGSGNLGFEALSNGAFTCYFVDHNKIAVKVIEENAKKLGISVPILKMDYSFALQYFQKNQIQFDIIFLDPPYKENLITPSFKQIEEYDLLKEHGIVVAEFEKEEVESELSLIKSRRYGSKNICIYKKV